MRFLANENFPSTRWKRFANWGMTWRGFAPTPPAAKTQPCLIGQ